MTARIAIIGKSGQLARGLLAAAPSFAAAMTCLGRADLPVHAAGDLERTLDMHRPDIVINAAAFSAVDLAESQPLAAIAINATLPLLLAGYCRARQLPFIHVSSDYVFDGKKKTPYREGDALGPINTYGRTKAAADLGILTLLPEAAIVRTSWVFSATGVGFPQKIIAAGRKNGGLAVVNDQIGRPTYAGDLASAVLNIAGRCLARDPAGSGIVNFANAEAVSWFEVAEEIVSALNAHDGSDITVKPIGSASLKLPADRPAYSVLDTMLYEERFRTTPRPWRAALLDILPTLMS
jgi:dTDP-4-dehydrorhamnose reductase